MSIGSSLSIIGMACRLPGVQRLRDIDDFLARGICSVSPAPQRRWTASRFLETSGRERGFTYSFAGGYLDDIFAFDPTVFGLSPREAEQMDPQQRVLLEVVWEALEDAGIAADRISGSGAGVYVGASGLDHASLFAADPAAIDSSFMTGNTLSVISNRISYCFDLRGPSYTVDTACSSSLVALVQAVSDLRSCRVDLAIVGGVNLLLSPIPFIGFSQASMISPTGLCRPFSADGDGYVRAEGAVAVVLCRAADAVEGAPRALLLDAQINSDGRTSGISLPALRGQVALLDRIYGGLGLDPDGLSFVEAHGTGTRVGDPIEAAALSAVLGRHRTSPLPIGSIKSNIGHLEPASGLAGLIKAVRALETRRLPASLHINAEKPLMNFEEAGLMPATAPVELARDGTLHAGVSSFGFGGTNAHAVLQSAPPDIKSSPRSRASRLVISAASPEALRDLVRSYATRIEAGISAGELAAAAGTHRSKLEYRAVVDVAHTPDLAQILFRFSAGSGVAEVFTGKAAGRPPKLCFIFPGNGLQWPGMGCAAYDRNEVFREAFDRMSREFEGLSGWSLSKALFDASLEDRLQRTSVAQPMIYAVQASIVEALAAEGVKPDFVLGHSLGEIAAACASGAMSSRQALRIIHERSIVQEQAHGRGSMAAAAADRSVIEGLGLNLDIAAENGPRSTTVSGNTEDMKAFTATARARRIAVRPLPLDYPFHSRHLDDLESELMKRLTGHVSAEELSCPMISSVTADLISAAQLDAGYWWCNMREPVRFQDGLQRAVALGAELFVEIGSRPVLLQPMKDVIKRLGHGFHVLSSLSESDLAQSADPVRRITSNVFAHGGAWQEDHDRSVDRELDLPTYAWQRKHFIPRFPAEGLDLFGRSEDHPLLGSRPRHDALEWRQILSVNRLGYLIDHRVDGEIVVPGAALVDMALSAARQMDTDGPIQLLDMDLLSPLAMSPNLMRELRLEIDRQSGHFIIQSRLRFEEDGWVLHAQGQIVSGSIGWARLAPLEGEPLVTSPAAIYEMAEAMGLQYGPSFRRIARHRHIHADKRIEIELSQPDGPTPSRTMLEPAVLDSVFQSLLGVMRSGEKRDRLRLPVRFGRVSLWADNCKIASAGLLLERETDSVSVWTMELRDELGTVVAGVEGAVFRAIDSPKTNRQPDIIVEDLFSVDLQRLINLRSLSGHADVQESWLLLRAYLRQRLANAMHEVAGKGRRSFQLSSIVFAQGGESLEPIMTMLCEDLVEGGLVERQGSDYRLCARSRRSPAPILRSFISETPDASADLLAVLSFAEELTGILRGTSNGLISPALRSRLLRDTLCLQPLRAAIQEVIQSEANANTGAKLRVLLLGEDAELLLKPLTELSKSGRILLGIAGLDNGSKHRLTELLPEGLQVADVDVSVSAGRPALLWDILVVSSAKPCVTGWNKLVAASVEHLGPKGLVLAAAIGHDPLLTAMLGTIPPDIHSMQMTLMAIGLQNAQLVSPTGLIRASKLAGSVEKPVASVPAQQVFECDTSKPLASLLMDLRNAVLAASESGQKDLWICCVTEDETVAQSVAAFLRVARLEFPQLAYRFLRCNSASDLTEQLVGSIAALAAGEFEFDLRDTLRIPRLFKAELDPRYSSLRLRGSRGNQVRTWEAEQRKQPEPGQVEVEVEAIGLNFRDVMLSSGILPEDLFSDGLAQSSIGFEFAGRILRIGDGVKGFQPGNRVAGVAPGAMATHVLARASDVTEIPEEMSAVIGASIPVAFLTAWYGLVELANVKAGERVLIHGAAGGVGLAAVQIAVSRGARVIATASTPAKRSLARAHGAEVALDSRSLNFVSAIRHQFGGVDVVLNSLGGSAMRESMRLLVPFGRFLELGKRDYAENSALGVRPLRENISYYGVDLDQLLKYRPDIIKRGLKFVMAGFSRNRFTPMPVFSFEADEVVRAFDTMRKGNHVGKIIVRPPRLVRGVADSETDKNGIQLVIGGTKGFGFETAAWLAENGYRTIVLASRSGIIDPQLAARVEDLQARGVSIVTEKVNVTMESSVKDLVQRIINTMGPVTGVVHSALHLEDGLISSLDLESIERVIAPKVHGVRHLWRALVDQPLRYFLMYSSVAAVTGNPGQAAYAAANAYLMGFADECRRSGRPCLAVAWGPIIDAGILSRTNVDAATTQFATLRAVAMTSRQAISALGQIMAEADRLPAAVICANLQELLKILPNRNELKHRFAFISGMSDLAKIGVTPSEVVRAIADLPEAEALALVREGVVAELAKILRMDSDVIDPLRPLDQLGLDSLMLVEFKMNFEARFGVSLPFLSINAFRNPEGMARRILKAMRNGDSASEALNLAPEERQLFETHRSQLTT